MATNHSHDSHHHHHEPVHSDVAYEHSDLGPRGIITFLVFLAIAAVVIHLAMAAMYKGFAAVSNRMQPEVSPLVKKTPAVSEGMIHNISRVNVEQFPEPRLQYDDVSDMNHFLTYEQNVLNAKPWSDPSGAVHLPINMAMQSVVQKGIQSRANASDPSQQDPMVVPSDSGFVGSARVKQEADSTALPEEPRGDRRGPSDREKESTIPGVNPTDIRNPSRPEAAPKGPEQPIKPVPGTTDSSGKTKADQPH